MLVGRHAEKLAIAEGWGISTRLSGAAEPGGEADVVVECTGHPQGFELARAFLRPRGRLVLKSTYHGTHAFDMSGWVVDEITLLGSRCGPFAPALRLMAAGLVDPRPLITATYPLADAAVAFGRAQAPGILKVLVRP
jgi:threonine dehydrogenase-like Zn-dependent dehydrogenase